VLHVLRKEYGYSFVRLEDESFGYVANEDLRVEPPTPPAVRIEELFPEPSLELPEPDFSEPVDDVDFSEPKGSSHP
jgi:hypothetical protein